VNNWRVLRVHWDAQEQDAWAELVVHGKCKIAFTMSSHHEAGECLSVSSCVKEEGMKFPRNRRKAHWHVLEYVGNRLVGDRKTWRRAMDRKKQLYQRDGGKWEVAITLVNQDLKNNEGVKKAASKLRMLCAAIYENRNDRNCLARLRRLLQRTWANFLYPKCEVIIPGFDPVNGVTSAGFILEKLRAAQVEYLSGCSDEEVAKDLMIEECKRSFWPWLKSEIAHRFTGDELVKVRKSFEGEVELSLKLRGKLVLFRRRIADERERLVNRHRWSNIPGGKPKPGDSAKTLLGID
jgi:hypothetical protein